MEKTDEITCPEDIFNWMEENVEYGWLDTEGNRHIREMKDFRKQYRTMSVEESMKQKNRNLHRTGRCHAFSAG